MTEHTVVELDVEQVNIPLERDLFMRTLIRELSGLLEEMIGLDEASGFISVVGQNIGSEIDQTYRHALKVPKLNRQQVSKVLVDLKHRINGDFYIIEQDDEKIVLGNRSCPFGDKVKDRPSLCMMTSNVFGTITAENLGYAKVALDKSIARGDSECHAVVYLQATDEAETSDGLEYFGTGS